MLLIQLDTGKAIVFLNTLKVRICTDALSVSTPWRCDEQHVINRKLPGHLPSLHKFVTWIQVCFEQCFVESVDDGDTVTYNHRKWILFKSGILNFVAVPS